MTTGVYEIKNKLNGKAYIGSSTNIEGRRSNHFCLLRRGTHHCVYLQHAWNKYGEKVFEFSILEELEGLGSLLAAEQKHLDSRFAQDGCYNIAITAGPVGPMAEETKRKLSLAITGRKLSEEHKRKIGLASRGNQYALGHKQTDEQRRETSERMMGNQYALGHQNRLGKKHTEETKRKISVAHMGNQYAKGNKSWLGKKHSDESKQKMSEAQKGRIFSKEHRKKLSEAHRGRKLSEDTKRKMGAARMGNKNALGYKWTAEQRRKQGETMKGWWATRKAGEEVEQ